MKAALLELTGKRIAVTGGRGDVGRAVVTAALARGCEVVEIDLVDPADGGRSPALTRVSSDLRSYDEFERAVAGCTALVHLAAYPRPGSRPEPEVHDDNVIVSYHALRVAGELGMTHACLASSINAIGGNFSRQARYDYLPVDEQHPTYNEDPYSLSKWIGEAQADSAARRYPALTIASLRFSGVARDIPASAARVRQDPAAAAKRLWSYTSIEATVSACLLSLTATFHGHEVFFIVAPHTLLTTPSLDLHRTYYPDVPLRRRLDGNAGFFDCAKAERLLGWHHDSPSSGEGAEFMAG